MGQDIADRVASRGNGTRDGWADGSRLSMMALRKSRRVWVRYAFRGRETSFRSCRSDGGRMAGASRAEHVLHAEQCAHRRGASWPCVVTEGLPRCGAW